MKNVLFIYDSSFGLNDVVWALIELGYDVDVFERQLYRTIYSPAEMEKQQEMITLLEEQLNSREYLFVFTYNFTPDISIVCEKHKVKYCVWTYDSIFMPLHCDQIRSPYNYIFVFDREEYLMLVRDFNPPHIYHLPLAANHTRIQATVIEDEDINKYACDISFVGTVYRPDKHYDAIVNRSDFPPNVKAYLNYITEYFVGRWNDESIYGCLDDEICKVLNNYSIVHEYDKRENVRVKISSSDWYAFSVLNTHIANRDREFMLSLLCSDFGDDYSVVRYGKPDELPFDIDQRGYIDYEKDFSKVAFLSRINMHLAPPSIMSGISLRCFDVMAAGGLLMADYRDELVEMFTPDVDFVLYQNAEELKEKVGYYLKNEDRRQQIAKNGYSKVMQEHSVVHRVIHMLKMMEV